LRIKETDRILALRTELRKLGADLIEESGFWKLLPTNRIPDSRILIQTYLDHRMAMAFAPLATVCDVTLENPGVVKKSYPGFWKDIEAVGIRTTET
jgi:3-phosphoshikimate 1-carboxyvinyltransferase